MQETILITIQKHIERIIVQSDSELVVNSINGKIGVSKYVVNLVKDIKCSLSHFSDSN